ncbi:MAG: hypothetical protein ACOY0T_25250 [Myxococcota bacterium]
MMVEPNNADPTRIDALLDAGDLVSARAALASVPDGDERFIVVKIKLGLYDGTLAPGAAMQQLIQLMRRDENFPGAKALYQEASSVAWQARQSNVAHSHPPPPARRRDS